MASPTLKSEGQDWTGPRIDHADFAARLVARRAQVQPADPPRNAGEHRTDSKRAMLRAIEDAGGNW